MCNGAGVVVVNDTTVQTCECVQAAKMREFLGDELRGRLRGFDPKMSPLVEEQAGYYVAKRHTQLITGQWGDVRPHLAFALLCLRAAHQGFSFRIASDAELRDIYFGQETHFPPWIKEPNLQVVRLGMLRVRNEAASQVVEEVILTREAPRVTWLVTDRTTPWDRAHRLWTKPLAELIEAMPKIQIGGAT